jgi:glycosyltransferase involved in cell wall biosynthesis
VLCSNATALREVAGDAAILFDPCDPAAIADAMHRLETEPVLEASLIERGRARLSQFGSAHDLALRYLAAFDQVVAARDRPQRR